MKDNDLACRTSVMAGVLFVYRLVAGSTKETLAN